MKFSPGDIISDKFRVERHLGEGGMGFVVCATHIALGQKVALKFMLDEALANSEIRSRFMREARAAGKLKSVHAARVLDVATLEDGSPYIVMEYLEGADLSAILRKRGRIPAEEVAEYIIQACEAVDEAHSLGIVHRDLKPANLFLAKGSGGRPQIKVLDFGVSKIMRDGDGKTDMDMTMAGGRKRPGLTPLGGRDLEDSVVTRVTDLLGSPNYMAPEQLASARDADPQSDIWSLGVILYRLTSGIMPFPADTQEELVYQVTRAPIAPLRNYVPNIPAGFDAVVSRCMERDKTRRYATARELARALSKFTGAKPSIERLALLGPADDDDDDGVGPAGTLVMPNAQVPPGPISKIPGSGPAHPGQIVVSQRRPALTPTHVNAANLHGPAGATNVTPNPTAPGAWGMTGAPPAPAPTGSRAGALYGSLLLVVAVVALAGFFAWNRLHRPSATSEPAPAVASAAPLRPATQGAVPLPNTGAPQVATVTPPSASARPAATVRPIPGGPRPSAAPKESAEPKEHLIPKSSASPPATGSPSDILTPGIPATRE